MKDFGRWFTEQGQTVVPQTTPVDDMLPEGLFDGPNGTFRAYCRACENTYEVSWDWQKEGFDQDMSYCGGSPRCCP